MRLLKIAFDDAFDDSFHDKHDKMEEFAANAFYSALDDFYVKGAVIPNILLKKILKSPRYSYWFAKQMSKAKVDYGSESLHSDIENSVIKDPFFAYQYALEVLKKPFSKGEKIIATNAEISYLYAKNVLKGPFKLGEKVIAKDQYFFEKYIDRVLYDPSRESESEKIIKEFCDTYGIKGYG